MLVFCCRPLLQLVLRCSRRVGRHTLFSANLRHTLFSANLRFTLFSANFGLSYVTSRSIVFESFSTFSTFPTFSPCTPSPPFCSVFFVVSVCLRRLVVFSVFLPCFFLLNEFKMWNFVDCCCGHYNLCY